MLPPSGEQIDLTRGQLSAVVTEVGATLRCLRFRAEPVLWEFPIDEIDSGARGQVLAPWPNRLEDGTYSFGDKLGRAPLDEPELKNAIHGLVRWLAFELEDRTEERVSLSCVIHPQPAYPFRVRVELDYELGESGLEVTCRAINTGSDKAPFGVGFHPYLLGGAAGIDEAGLALAARRRLILNERCLPVGEELVSGTDFALDGGPVGSRALNECYTEPVLSPDGRWHARLQLPGRITELWADSAFGYIMCYTGDSFEEPALRRRAVAIEPMTCPPNALRTGTSLIELHPGEQWQAAWGILVAPS